MRPIVVVAVAISCMLAGFAAGWFYQSNKRTPETTIEDYAITSILNELAYARSIASGDAKNAKVILDSSLHANLNRVREHSGAIKDPEFVEARVRTLQALAMYWQANPPFTSSDYESNESNASWIGAWKRDRAQNVQLLAWALNECASHPEFKCKQR